MIVKLFILGRPGSGKSTVARYITKLAQHEGWIPTRYCDYDILHNMFQAELHNPSYTQQHFEPVDHDGFRVTDFSILDPTLQTIQKRAAASVAASLRDCNLYAQRLIVIEFARDDYVDALRQFDPAYLHDAHFLFLDCDVDLSIQRIHDRVAHPESADDHFVSDDIITGYYQKESTPHMIHALADEFILNEQKMEYLETYGSRDAFLHEYVRDYARHLLESSSSQPRIMRASAGAFSSNIRTIYSPSNCPSPSILNPLAALTTDSLLVGVSAYEQPLLIGDEPNGISTDDPQSEVSSGTELAEVI